MPQSPFRGRPSVHLRVCLGAYDKGPMPWPSSNRRLLSPEAEPRTRGCHGYQGLMAIHLRVPSAETCMMTSRSNVMPLMVTVTGSSMRQSVKGHSYSTPWGTAGARPTLPTLDAAGAWSRRLTGERGRGGRRGERRGGDTNQSGREATSAGYD